MQFVRAPSKPLRALTACITTATNMPPCGALQASSKSVIIRKYFLLTIFFICQRFIYKDGFGIVKPPAGESVFTPQRCRQFNPVVEKTQPVIVAERVAV